MTRFWVTRNRRTDAPQLAHPEGYDEYVDGKPTGRMKGAKPMTAPETFVVICAVGMGEDSARPYRHYALATRHVFATFADAEKYAAGVNGSRSPIVVAGDWAALRFPGEQTE